MQLAEAYVEVKTNQAKFTKELKTMESSVKRSVDRMKKNFDRIGRGVSEISKVARYGFIGMVAAIAGVTYAAQKQEKAVAKLVQQLKNHNEYTQENIDALTGQASALQKLTQFGDEQIIAGQAMLASFSLTTQQIKDLTPHMLNLAIMTENTTGQQADLASVAKMVGVALSGQAGRLVQMGIKLSEAQKEMLRLAEEHEKINILMQIFEENAGGLAEATGKTLAGSLAKAKNAMGDLAEEIGFVLSPVIVKACEAIVAKVNEWIEAIRALTPAQKKLITQIVFLGTAALAAIGALGLFSTVARVVQAAGLIIAGTAGLIASPLGLIMLAVGALALVWAYNWGDIQGKTEKVWKVLEPIFKAIWEWLGKAWEWALKNVPKAWDWLIENIWPTLKIIFQGIWDWLEKAWVWSLENLPKAWDWLTDTLWPALKDIFQGIWDWLQKSWEWLLGEVPKAWDWLKDTLWPKLEEIFQGIWDWLTKAWDWSLDKVKEAWKWFEETLIPFLKKWGKATLEWTLKKVGAVWDTIMDFFSGVKDWIKAKFSWTLEKVGPIWDAIIGFFADAKDWLVKKFSWTLEKAGEMWDWFTNTLIPMLWSWSETTFHWLLELGGTVWDKFKGIMQWVKEHAVFYFNWALIKIGETWDWLTDKLWPWIKEWGVRAFEWGLKLIGDIWNWLKDTLIPWVKEWKEKTFEWTLNLLGDAWDKIQELLEWLKIIPKELEGVVEAAEKTGEAVKKIAPAEVIKDLSHLIPIIRGQKLALEEASKGWETYNQVAKRQIAATAANFILFEHEITDLAAKAPLEFAEEFQKAFMKAEPKIQKTILDALTARDFQRAVDLAGIKAGHIFLHGRSPGGIIGELEEGQKDLSKQLDKMLGSMDAMTKKMMKVFQPIIGLFKKMFEGITDTMIKSENETISQMGKDIKAFVGDILAMMEGLFDALEEEADEHRQKWFEGWALLTKKGKSLWQKFCEKVGNLWKLICESIKAAFSDAMVAVIAGTQTIAQAFQALQKAVAVELAKMAVAAIAAGDIITGILAGVTAAFTALGIRIRETTTHFETAWGTLGRNFYFTTMKMAENVNDFCNMLETEFNRVGLAISKTIEDAQYKLEGLYQSQYDLQVSTKEKLIAELDKYYDYRTLKEMSLDELLALSAETRVGIETGAIKEVEESEAEQEARRKDQAVNRLKRIEDQYRREDELMRRKIALIEIEIKFLELKMEREAHGHSARAKQLEKELDQMLYNYKEGVKAYDEAEKEKREATEETAETVEEAAKDMTEAEKESIRKRLKTWIEAEKKKREGMEETERTVEKSLGDMTRFWEKFGEDVVDKAERIWSKTGAVPRSLAEAIETMKDKIGELPTQVFFDVIGELHMPTITAPGPVWFDIFGRYKAPSIPSAQIGIPNIPRPMPVFVHKGEAILNPPQAREWRAGKGGGKGGTQVIYERGSIRMTVMGSINQQVDLEKAMDYLARKQDQIMRRG